jgi:hypothetical protein
MTEYVDRTSKPRDSAAPKFICGPCLSRSAIERSQYTRVTPRSCLWLSSGIVRDASALRAELRFIARHTEHATKVISRSPRHRRHHVFTCLEIASRNECRKFRLSRMPVNIGLVSLTEPAQ